MNIYKCFLYNSETKWHLITILLCMTFFIATLLFMFFLHKTKKLSLYLIQVIIAFLKSLIISTVIFRTLYLHYAFVIWAISYFFMGYTENKTRKIRYINAVGKENIKYRKDYKRIHNISKNKKFINSINESCLLFKNYSCGKIDKKDRTWKKSFLPFNYFMIGLIIPNLNLVFNRSQYFSYDVLFFKLLETNILIFSILWFLYPITHFLAVKIETGIMFQSKIWFDIGYFLFSIAVFIAFNGILIVG